MAKERSKYQQKIIRNYYNNRGAISLQRLGELVTDLYLAEGKSRAAKWKQAASAMEKLGVKADQIEHIVQQDNPALVAKMVKDLLGKE